MRRKTMIGYSDEISVVPGESLRFMVSAEAPTRSYTATIVRILSGDDQPGGPGYRQAPLDTAIDNKTFAARHQPIYPGSYGIVEHGPVFDCITSFTLQVLVWPTTPDKDGAVIVGKFCADTGFGFALAMGEHGRVRFVLGDDKDARAEVVAPDPLIAREWYLLAATYDAATGTMRLRQRMLSPLPGLNGTVEATGVVKLTHVDNQAAHFMAAACNERTASGAWIPGRHFNGRIERPALSRSVLSDDEIESLVRGPLPQRLSDGVVLAWDFSEAMGTDRLVDLSANRLDGTAVNLPIRAVRGSSWDGSEMNWSRTPEQYGAIHFNDDALYDAGWEPDFEVTIPAATASGFFAAHLTGDDGAEDHIPFFVRPPRDRATADLALLVPTASYLAYANMSVEWRRAMTELNDERVPVFGPEQVYAVDHPEIGLSMYDYHNDGTGVIYSSRLRPVTNLRPRHLSLWQYPADLHLLAWLEHEGRPFDVLTDEDLHAEGADLLGRYTCVMTCSHPEYYSTAMFDGIAEYLQAGGRLMYMGGNGFYWRVAYRDDKPGVIEMRRAEDGSRSWIAEPGEYYMGFTGEYGGLWWRCGRTPQSLVGVGFIAQGDDASFYRRQPGSFDPRAAWIFNGIRDDELIGDFGLLHGGAAGIELDRYDRLRGSPAHALILASSDGHGDGMLLVAEELEHMHTQIKGPDNPAIHADLVFFETAKGGAVFSTGSIAWCGSLPWNGFDNNVSRLTRNVVTRFLDSTPF